METYRAAISTQDTLRFGGKDLSSNVRSELLSKKTRGVDEEGEINVV